MHKRHTQKKYRYGGSPGQLPQGVYHVLAITDSANKITSMYLSSDYFLPYTSTSGPALVVGNGKKYVGMVDVRPTAIDQSPMNFALVPNTITEFNQPKTIGMLPTKFP